MNYPNLSNYQLWFKFCNVNLSLIIVQMIFLRQILAYFMFIFFWHIFMAWLWMMWINKCNKITPRKTLENRVVSFSGNSILIQSIWIQLFKPFANLKKRITNIAKRYCGIIKRMYFVACSSYAYMTPIFQRYLIILIPLFL